MPPRPRTIEEAVRRSAYHLTDSEADQARYAEVYAHLLQLARTIVTIAAQEDPAETLIALGGLQDEAARARGRRGRRS